jgi:hypothetical protein
VLGSSLDGRGWADRCGLLVDQHRVFERFPRPLQRLSAESKQTSCLAELAGSNIVHLLVARSPRPVHFGCRTTARPGRTTSRSLSKGCLEVCVLFSPCDETRSREARHLRLARGAGVAAGAEKTPASDEEQERR